MKTNYFSIQNTLLKSITALLGLAVVSCGSYQNNSYYDNDGIYGAKKERRTVENTEQVSQVEAKTNESGNKYKEYFASNANNYSTENSEVLTDVENYSTSNGNETQESNATSYSSWENTADHVTINVYDNSWGGYNYGYWNNYWGYNNPWNYGFYSGWVSP